MASKTRNKKYVMFIDETGTSKGPNPFTITGVIMEYKYCIDPEHGVSPLKHELNRFKNNCFGTTNIHLHLKQITACKTPFTVSEGVTLRHIANFWTRLPNFLNGIDMKIISVTVDKTKVEQYYSTPKDYYVVAFSHLLESFYSFLNNSDVESARIVLESRDEFLNLEVQKAFFDIFNAGTATVDVQMSKNKIKGFEFANKTDATYQSGLELADLVCNPLNRARLGKIDANPTNFRYGKENKIFKALKEKIYIGEGVSIPDPTFDFRNWGFKKIPVVKRQRQWEDDTNVNKEIEYNI